MKPQLSDEGESILEKNLVWILGSPRSGTSWLALELLSYNTISINEMHFTDHFGIGLVIQNRFIRIFDMRKNQPDYFFSDKYNEIWKFYLRKLILQRIYAQIKNLSKKIIIKEPEADGGSADLISEFLPSARLIILLRDGRDILDSIRGARQKGSFMVKSKEVTVLTQSQRLQFIDTRAKKWIALVESLMKAYHNHSKNLCILVKYEDLRKNTFDEVKKIYKFLEIDISEKELVKIVEKFTFENLPDEVKGKGKFHRAASPGLWKENFDEEEKELMEKIMGPTLRKLGY